VPQDRREILADYLSVRVRSAATIEHRGSLHHPGRRHRTSVDLDELELQPEVCGRDMRDPVHHGDRARARVGRDVGDPDAEQSKL
jgi:hypothetical protein